MKISWRNWTRAVWAVAGRESSRVNDDDDLQLKSFWTALEYKQLQASMNGSWLIITNYFDQDRINWLQVYQSNNEFPQPEALAIGGNNLAIGRHFFASQQREFIELALKTMNVPLSPTLLDEASLIQWQLIIEKIACNMECNYIFHKEFLQELVLHAIHFILKYNSVITAEPLTVTI